MKRICPYFLCLFFATSNVQAQVTVDDINKAAQQAAESREDRLERRVASLEKLAEQVAKYFVEKEINKPQPRLSKPEVVYKTITVYERRPIYGTVKRCQNGRCWFETVITGYQNVPVQKRVPVSSSQRVLPEAQPTPMKDVKRILEILKPKPTDIFVDFGCGADARFVIEAVRTYGCRGLGIEIDRERAIAAQRAVDDSGHGKRIRIVHGDSTKLKIQADVGVAYLYPDTLKALTPNIKRLKRFASYQHKVEGLPTTDYGNVHVYAARVAGIRTAAPLTNRPPHAVWGGRYYTGRLCNNPGCTMCASIQRQLGY